MVSFCLVSITSKFPPCTTAPSVPVGLVEELSAVVLVPTDALLTQLLAMRSFAECVLSPTQSKATLSQCLSQHLS